MFARCARSHRQASGVAGSPNSARARSSAAARLFATTSARVSTALAVRQSSHQMVAES